MQPSSHSYTKQDRIIKLGPDFKTFLGSRTLTISQQRFIDSFFSSSNVFLTGAAGTGKSFVVQLLFDFLVKNGISIGKTSSTGISAFQIGGQTIHSFAGLGLGDEDVETIIEKLKKYPKARARIKAIDVLFIDEISMIKGDLLDKIDIIFKYFRFSDKPFGGVKFITSGDPLQLVSFFKGEEVKKLFFQCRSWEQANIKRIVLDQSVRHKGDGLLLKILNDIRVGDTSSINLLKPRINAKFEDNEIEPVRIFCKNADVSEYNQQRLSKLSGQSKSYFAKDNGSDYHIEAFNKNCPAPDRLDLKVGAQCLLLVNWDTENGFVNGSTGIIKAFGPNGVTVKFKNGTIIVEHHQWDIKEQEVGIDGKIKYKVVATRQQIPLKVCYALTTHRVQGMTLDRAILDIGEAFASGQVYTSLSRVRTLDSLSIIGGIPHKSIIVNKDCLDFYKEAKSGQ